MIPPRFHRCLELAWEAYQAGSFPIGALVCDGSGTVVAEGHASVADRLRLDDAWPDRTWSIDRAIAHVASLLPT